MKRHTRTSYAVCTLTGLLLVTILISAGCALADEGCTNQSWHGTYVVSINGFRASQPPPQLIGASAPVAVIGTFTFDGAGNVSRFINISAGGQDFALNDVGTYSVNANCTGQASFTDVAEVFALTTVDSKTVSIVTVTPGEAGAGTLVKQHVSVCNQNQLEGTYVFSGNGWGAFQPPPQLLDSFFAVGVSGTWSFDGKGSVSRNLNLSFFGFTFPYQDSGTYQVNPDCTASAYFPSDTEPFVLVVVDTQKVMASALSVPGVSRAGAATLAKQHLDD